GSTVRACTSPLRCSKLAESITLPGSTYALEARYSHSHVRLAVLMSVFGFMLLSAGTGMLLFVAEYDVNSCQPFARRLVAASSIVLNVSAALGSPTSVFNWNVRGLSASGYSNQVIDRPGSSAVPTLASGPGSGRVFAIV